MSFNSKFLLIFGLIVAITNFNASTQACPSVCPENIDPVYPNCNGTSKYFSNKCFMDAYNCENDNICTFTEPEKDDLNATTRKCPTMCTANFDPVHPYCNGTLTYFSNTCFMNIYNCENDNICTFIEPEKDDLNATTRECPSMCPENIDPVYPNCNGTSKYFSNKCFMDAYNCENDNICTFTEPATDDTTDPDAF